MVATFTADKEFERSDTIIFDLSQLKSIKIDVTRSSDKVMKVGSNFPRDGGRIVVLAPTETSVSMAQLLRGLWDGYPQVTFQIFKSDIELLIHLGIEQDTWDALIEGEFSEGQIHSRS
ncbi:hypothetical protein HFZ77_01975 [Thalassovita gelatinovora]|nr:hypothetical protein [Thalassovita gelatinovora]QIZ79324.1 hypothetical protein HFZ77_01975 [Thalassovita gelatinovora]